MEVALKKKPSRRPQNLSLEPDAVAHAERYAERHGTSVSRLVSDFLASLPLGAPARELTPVVRRLLGAAAGSDVDREDYRRHLHRKYGR